MRTFGVSTGLPQPDLGTTSDAGRSIATSSTSASSVRSGARNAAGATGRPSPLTGLRQDHADHARLERRAAIRRGPALTARFHQVASAERSSQAGGVGPASRAEPAVPLASLKQPAKTKAPHYERRDMPTDALAVRRLGDEALLASYPYHRDRSQLPRGWAPEPTLSEAVRDRLKLHSHHVEGAPGAIVDRDSGLAAVLLQNRETRELVLSFGGTTAGKKTGQTLMERSKPGRNFMSTLSQWGANLYAGLGGTPKSYRQAADLLAAVQKGMKEDPALQGFSLRVVGHSKGGGEAMYASLKSETPVPVTAFCPAHLSDGLVKQLPAENLKRAKDLVASFSPQGDPVAGMRGKLPGMQGVGAGFHFPAIPKRSAMNVHDQFQEHVQHYCRTALADLAV